MTSPRRRPARGVRRWTTAALALVTSVTFLAPLLGAPQAHAAPLRTDLRLTQFTPISLDYGKTVRASGTFETNQRLDNVVVRLEVGNTPFLSRSAISEAVAAPPSTFAVPGAEDNLRRVNKNQTVSFRITLPVDDLALASAGVSPGVFPMRIVAVDQDTGQELTSVSSFLPWAPEGVGVTPSRLLMIWPVIGESELVTGGSDGAPDSDGMLDASLSAGGRLQTLVNAGASAPATWIVDPALLDQVDSLNTGAADSWLESMAAEARSKPMVALPYGDPDVAAVGSAGRPGFLVQGQRKGDNTFVRMLNAIPRSDLAWPADGAGDEDTIAVSARSGDDFVLLDGENAPLVTPLTYTPSGRIEWRDPNVDVLLADESASALMASPASTAEDVLLTRQRFLAETLLHSREFPSAERLLVIAPPRRWDPSASWANELATAVRKASWLDPVSLNESVEPSLAFFEREAPSIPEDAAARQLPAAMVQDAQAALTDNRRFAAILTRPQELAQPINDDLFTSVSTAWRTDRVAAEESQDEVIDHLRSMRGKVRIVSQGGTLADDRGSFPVTLRNQLDQPVIVGLEVTSTDSLRLRVKGSDPRIRIAPQQSYSAVVELDAVTSGRLSFDAQLRTPGGAPYSDPVTVSVDVRAFGQITLVVFGVALALLVLAAAIRLVRRVRGSRRSAA